MVKAIYNNEPDKNKKGIYKDLYRTLNEQKDDVTPIIRNPKGIYANLYRQLEQDKKEMLKPISFKETQDKKEKTFGLLLNIFNTSVSKAYCLFSSTTEIGRLLVFSLFLARRPVTNYVNNCLNLQQNKDKGNNLNGR